MKAKLWLLYAGVSLAAGLMLSLAGCADPAAETAQPADAVVDAIENQQFCPVMPDMKIDRNIYVDHDGKRVYLCCAGCVAAFRAEPEKYLEKLRALHADPDAPDAPALPEATDDHDHQHDHDHG